MTTHVVSNVLELNSILETASGGDRIELKAGDYGDLKLRDLNFSSEIVITAQDGANPPEFNTISVWQSNNLTFDGLDVNMTPTMDTLEWSAAVRVDGSSDISIINSTITGGESIAGIDPDAAAGTQGNAGILGFPVGNGISFYDTNNVTVENNIISEFTGGVRFNDVDGIELNNNEIFDFRKVPVGGGNVNNVTMEGNYFHDATPWKFGGLGDHGDFVHFWTHPDQETPSDNFVFRGNFFDQGEGAPILGIYLDDNKNDMGFENVLIENNIIHSDNSQALRMEDVVGMTISHNTFLPSSEGENNFPGILLADGNRDVLIEQNIYSELYGPGFETAGRDNIVLSNNMTVQSDDPAGADFAGNFFLNLLAENPELADLQVIPGSAAEGFGAQFGSMSTAYITEMRGEDLELSTHNFDIYLAQPGSVQWDFGDGTSANGANVTHTYDAPGVYEVTATVQPQDGEPYLVVRNVGVVSPVALSADFEGQLDADTALTGDAQLVMDDGDQAVRLQDARSTVTFERTPAMTDNDAFTISFAFKKDIGAENDGGRALYFSGTAVIDLSADGITLRGRTDAEESITLRGTNVGINDSDWHQVTYTMSQDSGSAILYVDGVEVAQVSGLEGGQYATSGHDLHLGNPFGETISGIMDDALFLRAALTPEQVQQEYQAFQQGTSLFSDAAPLPYSPPEDMEPPREPEEVEPHSIATPIVQEEDPGPQKEPLDSVINLGGAGTSHKIERELVDHILSTDNFSIKMELSANEQGNSGEVVRLHQSFVTSVNADGELELLALTQLGERIRLTTDGANLSDGNIHKIGISRENGILTINVDGEVLASGEMSAPLADKGYQNLIFGNPWNRENFEGRMLSLEITSEDEVFDTGTPNDEVIPKCTKGLGLELSEPLQQLSSVPATKVVQDQPTPFETALGVDGQNMLFLTNI